MELYYTLQSYTYYHHHKSSCFEGLPHVLFPFNTRLTLWMTIISSIQTFPSSLAAASLPPTETKQRMSHLLLLLNDRNKSNHPLLSSLTEGGREEKSLEMGKLTIPGIPAWLLLLNLSVGVFLNEWTCNISPMLPPVLGNWTTFQVVCLMGHPVKHQNQQFHNTFKGNSK